MMLRILVWLVLAVWGLFILTLIGVADAGRATMLFAWAGRIPAGDKFCHLALFGTMAFLANVALNGSRLRLGPGTVLKGSLFVLVPTVIEEFSQLFLRSRTFDPVDLLADGVGVFLGGWMALLLLRRGQGSLALASAPSESRGS